MKKILFLVVMALVLCSGRLALAGDMIQVKGSDTLINLVQRLSEVYMERYPGKHIAVTGGGSGTGIAALINGKCDIANASRLMKAKEVNQAGERGVKPERVVIALDGLSVVVNYENPVKKLTMEELGRIFRGEVTNWKEIGGEDTAITLYGRQSNSGTFDFFREVVLKGDYSSRMRRMNGNAQIIEAVRHDRSGIGYVGVGYAKEASGIIVLKVASSPGSPYASPLDKSDVESGAYPITRPLNQYINGVPEGGVRDFLEFELSPAGQKIVEEEGFFALPAEYRVFNLKKSGI